MISKDSSIVSPVTIKQKQQGQRLS